MITSAQNPRLQRLRLLNTRRKARDESEEFLIEGVRLFEEALRAEWPPRMVLFSPGLSSRGQELVARCRVLGAEVEEVDPRLLKSVLDTENPQGLAGIFAFRKRIPPSQPNFLVIADQLRDPGNLGTLLRSAEAAGAQGVYLTPGTVDAYSPKVLRSAMGAHFRLPVIEMGYDELAMTIRSGLKLYAADAESGADCWSLDLSGPLALAVGGEAEGIGPEIRALADGFVRIPMPGRAESLNAAVAAGVLLFEVVRQRIAQA
jgi:TrmH family RNA methyltransferase